jgi:hypothetical protein
LPNSELVKIPLDHLREERMIAPLEHRFREANPATGDELVDIELGSLVVLPECIRGDTP